MSNLAKRLLSAAVLIPPVLWAFVAGGWWLEGLALVVATLCLWEYTGIVVKGETRNRAVTIVIGVATLLAALLFDNGTHALLAVNLGLVALGSMFVLSPGEFASAWRRLSMLQFGVVYVALGLYSVCELRALGQGFEGAGKGAFLIVAMTATWANDTCAYFAGRAFGKHKMAEQISPKKTWEGFVGGALGTLVFLFSGRALFPTVFAPVSPLDLVLVALPTAFLGPMGDLAESLLKRNWDVKDSSNIIPGHGGMLDRIDAVLFVAPWVLFYFSAIKPALGL